MVCRAAAKGDLRAIKLLCEGGANASLEDYDRRNPAHIAAGRGLLEVVKYLFENAREMFEKEDCWGRTPLLEATRTRQQAVIDFLSSFDD